MCCALSAQLHHWHVFHSSCLIGRHRVSVDFQCDPDLSTPQHSVHRVHRMPPGISHLSRVSECRMASACPWLALPECGSRPRRFIFAGAISTGIRTASCSDRPRRSTSPATMKREISLFPELVEPLRDAFDQVEPGSEFVITRLRPKTLRDDSGDFRNTSLSTSP